MRECRRPLLPTGPLMPGARRSAHLLSSLLCLLYAFSCPLSFPDFFFGGGGVCFFLCPMLFFLCLTFFSFHAVSLPPLMKELSVKLVVPEG